MQKKAYRVLEEMCGGERGECSSFVLSNLETLKVVLLETLKNASSPAKRVRKLRGDERRRATARRQRRPGLPALSDGTSVSRLVLRSPD